MYLHHDVNLLTAALINCHKTLFHEVLSQITVHFIPRSTELNYTNKTENQLVHTNLIRHIQIFLWDHFVAKINETGTTRKKNSPSCAPKI